jgi:hypothetical protein
LKLRFVPNNASTNLLFLAYSSHNPTTMDLDTLILLQHNKEMEEDEMEHGQRLIGSAIALILLGAEEVRKRCAERRKPSSLNFFETLAEQLPGKCSTRAAVMIVPT